MNGLRKGMWVVHGGKIGILNDIGADGGEVHLVNDEGETIEVVCDVPLERIKQAGRMNIPEARRPDEESAAALGYV